MSAYAELLRAWHDFYLVAGGAAATLAALLFVGLSLHLRTVLSRPEVRNLARVTLVNFVCVLVVALVVVVPTAVPWQTGLQLLIPAVLSLAATVPGAANAVALKGRSALRTGLLVRRFGFSLICYVALIGVALAFFAGRSDDALVWLVGVVITLLYVAVYNSWDLLVTVGEEVER
jgi:hypothetical protein